MGHRSVLCPLIFVKIFFRVVTKISSCWVNTTSRRGIKRLGSSFGSIFLLFSNKSSRGPLSQQPGKIPGPRLLMTTLYLYKIFVRTNETVCYIQVSVERDSTEGVMRICKQLITAAMNKDFSFPGTFIRGLFHIPVSFHRKYMIT